MNYVKPILPFFLGAALLGCDTYDEHTCDPSKEIDFRYLGDISGTWESDAAPSLDIVFDDENRIRTDGFAEFGCDPRDWPLVLNERNTLGGGNGPDGGQAGLSRRLVGVVLRENLVVLVHTESHTPESRPRYTIITEMRFESESVMEVSKRDFYPDDSKPAKPIMAARYEKVQENPED